MLSGFSKLRHARGSLSSGRLCCVREQDRYAKSGDVQVEVLSAEDCCVTLL